MAKKCSKKNPCRKPRSLWWKKTLGVDWFDQTEEGFTPSPEYQAVLDEATALGYTLPSAAQQVIENAALAQKIADGSFALADGLYNFVTDGSKDFTKINLKNPTGPKLVEVGTCTFTPLSGWKFTGGGYLRTQFIPSTHGVNYTRNSATMGLWTDRLVKLASRAIGCYDGTSVAQLFPREVANKASAYIHTSGGGGAQFFDLTDDLLTIGKRTASNALAVTMMGLPTGINTTEASVVLPTVEFFIGAANHSGTATDKDNTGTYRYAYWGSGAMNDLKMAHAINMIVAPTQPIIVESGIRNIKTDALGSTHLQGKDGCKIIQTGDYLWRFGGWNDNNSPKTTNEIWRAHKDTPTAWTLQAAPSWFRRHSFCCNVDNDGVILLYGADLYGGSVFANSATVSAVNGQTSLTTSANHGVAVGKWILLKGVSYQAVAGTETTTLVLNKPYAGITETVANADTLNMTAHDCWKGEGGSTGTITWTQTNANLPFDFRILYGGDFYDGKHWIVGGQSDITNPTFFDDFWYTEDLGVNWTQASTGHAELSNKNLSNQVKAFNGAMYIVSGASYNGSSFTAACYKTTNGVTLTRTAGDIQVPVMYSELVVHSNRLWALFGVTQAESNGDNYIQYMNTSESWGSFRNNIIQKRHAAAGCELTQTGGVTRILTGSGTGYNDSGVSASHNDVFILDVSTV